MSADMSRASQSVHFHLSVSVPAPSETNNGMRIPKSYLSKIYAVFLVSKLSHPLKEIVNVLMQRGLLGLERLYAEGR